MDNGHCLCSGQKKIRPLLSFVHWESEGRLVNNISHQCLHVMMVMLMVMVLVIVMVMVMPVEIALMTFINTGQKENQASFVICALGRAAVVSCWRPTLLFITFLALYIASSCLLQCSGLF